jgi:hypothetical protein
MGSHRNFIISGYVNTLKARQDNVNFKSITSTLTPAPTFSTGCGESQLSNRRRPPERASFDLDSRTHFLFTYDRISFVVNKGVQRETTHLQT